MYLENSLGLLEGTGRGEVSLDLRPAHEAGLRRVMLFGRNGSGKSTLLRALNPFHAGPDGETGVVPGRPGRKLIEFARPDGSLVSCDVRWGRAGKAACFLSVNGEVTEQTRKGNVGEYLAAVRDELGATPAFLKIGRLGGRISGFLEMQPTARKSYIGQFMPEVEEWQAMHRNASRRLLLLTNELKGIQVELERVEPREALEAEANRAEAERAAASEAVRASERVLGSARGAQGELRRARDEVLARHGLDPAAAAFNPAGPALEEASRREDRAAASLAALLEERPALAPFAGREAAAEKAAALAAQAANLDGQLQGGRRARHAARAALDGAISAREAAEARLRGVESSGAQAEALEAQAARHRAEGEALAASPALLHPGALQDGAEYAEVKAACDALAELESQLAAARGAFSSPDALAACAALSFDPDAVRAAAEAERAAVAQLRERHQTALARASSIESQLVFHRELGGMHCRDPKCPFEAFAAKFADVPRELAEKRAEAARLAERIAEREAAADAARADEGASRQARQLYAGYVQRHRRAWEQAGVWASVSTLGAFGAMLLRPGTELAEALGVRGLLEAVAARRDLAEARRLQAAAEGRLADVRALAAARGAVEEAAAAARAEEGRLRAALAAADEEAAALERRAAAAETARGLLERVVSLHAAREAAEAEARGLADAAAALGAMLARWEAASAEAGAAEASLAGARAAEARAAEALQRAALKRSRRDEYEGRLADVDGRVAAARAVADACHPTRGAPVELIRGFLDTTEALANELLDVAMGGEFRVGFEVSDTEFRVPVYRGSGRKVDDVTEVSEGQFALGKTVISLALVKQTVRGSGRYNILQLDEIDGPLDEEKNRGRFGAIVDRLADDLGSSQVFIISHNDAFAADPCALVLFPGHCRPTGDASYMSNKVVLAEY